MRNTDVFGSIYKNRTWGDGTEGNPRSGTGSDPINAQIFVHFVRDFITSRKISTVLDVGHGDWEMWKEYSFAEVDYLGLDIAAGLSEEIQAKYGKENRKFQYYDFEGSNLPSADLLICKDVLQHLSSSDCVALLEKMKQFKFLVICNDVYVRESIIFEIRNYLLLGKRLRMLSHFKSPFFAYKRRNNSNIETGEFRGINLLRRPFVKVLRNFQIIPICDFDAPKLLGIKKRIYLLVNKDPEFN